MNIIKIYVLNSLKDIFKENKQTEKANKSLGDKEFLKGTKITLFFHN